VRVGAGMQVAVEKALPAPQSVDGGADVQLPRFDRTRELVEIEQALVASTWPYSAVSFGAAERLVPS
jgi:hypothetical protein